MRQVGSACPEGSDRRLNQKGPMAIRPIPQTESRTAEGWPEKIGTGVGVAVSVLTTAMIIWPLIRHMLS